MSTDNVMQALFQQQRLQIMHLGVYHEEFTDCYLYAWYAGVYPWFNSTDGTVLKMPHEMYEDQFVVKREKVGELIKMLDELWLAKKVPTFYELEDMLGIHGGFGNTWGREEVIDICRYVYLRRGFDKQFWTKLLTPMEHPSEASYIASPFVRESDIYFM